MDIEFQRWAPLAASCAPDFELLEGGISHPKGTFGAWDWDPYQDFPLETGEYVDEALDLDEKVLVTNLIDTWIPPVSAGCYVSKGCTEYASYPRSWKSQWSATGAEIAAAVKTSFAGKGTRILQLTLDEGFPGPIYASGPGGLGVPNGMWAILIPNYGAAAKAWWWSGSTGATAQEVTNVLNGKAWPGGNFKQDNIKKRLVSIARSHRDNLFRFVVNEWKPGEGWWWGHGATLANITDVINGKAWADFRADKIEKRLVYLKRHGGDNWTFLMVPRDGLGWWWYPKIEFKDLAAHAKQHNARIIDMQTWSHVEDHAHWDLLSGILVQNT